MLAATTWWPLSVRLAGELLQQGCSVEGIRRYHLYSRINSLRALQKATVRTRPKLVIPCDDGVVWQLHQPYQQQPELRTLIARSLGAAKHFEVVARRERLQEIAQELHIRVPHTNGAESADDLRRGSSSRGPGWCSSGTGPGAEMECGWCARSPKPNKN